MSGHTSATFLSASDLSVSSCICICHIFFHIHGIEVFYTTLESCHRDNHSIFSYDSGKLNSRNTVFLLNNLPRICACISLANTNSFLLELSAFGHCINRVVAFKRMRGLCFFTQCCCLSERWHNSIIMDR